MGFASLTSPDKSMKLIKLARQLQEFLFLRALGGPDIGMTGEFPACSGGVESTRKGDV
jgi:hypothetical protein